MINKVVLITHLNCLLQLENVLFGEVFKNQIDVARTKIKSVI